MLLETPRQLGEVRPVDLDAAFLERRQHRRQRHLQLAVELPHILLVDEARRHLGQPGHGLRPRRRRARVLEGQLPLRRLGREVQLQVLVRQVGQPVVDPVRVEEVRGQERVAVERDVRAQRADQLLRIVGGQRQRRLLGEFDQLRGRVGGRALQRRHLAAPRHRQPRELAAALHELGAEPLALLGLLAGRELILRYEVRRQLVLGGRRGPQLLGQRLQLVLGEESAQRFLVALARLERRGVEAQLQIIFERHQLPR